MKKSLIVLAALLIVVIIFVFFVYLNYGQRTEQGSLPSNAVATSSSPYVGVEDIVKENKPINISISEGQPALDIKQPSFDRPITFSANYAGDKDNLAKKIADIESKIKMGNNNPANWAGLGLYFKNAGDYKTAEEFWAYATLAWPKDYTAFINLGELYHYYLKDYPKAEASMLKVLEIQPNFVTGYINLFDLYNLSYKEKAEKAAPALIKALGIDPQAVDVMAMLAEYYADHQQIEQAKKYYNMAIEQAKKDGDKRLEDSLTQDLSKL